MNEDSPGHGIVLPECAEAAELFRPDAWRALHLDPDETPGPVQYQVHLQPRRRPPVMKLVLPSQVLVERAKLLEHQGLQRGPADLRLRIQGAPGTDRLKHPGVEEIELGMSHHPPFGPSLEHRQPQADQEILENGKVSSTCQFPGGRK